MSANSQILNHPEYNADFVAKSKAANFSDNDIIDFLDGVASDKKRAQVAAKVDNSVSAVAAARAVGKRLGSRKAMMRQRA